MVRRDRDKIIMEASKNLLNHNDSLMEERDETRKWILEIANYLKVEPDDGEKSVREDWARFREKILKAVKAL